jgi:hypothetical protein
LKSLAASLLAMSLAACATMESGVSREIDAIARDYVQLVLEIDTYEPGYVDAYYGPEAWREAAKANPRTRDALKAEADRLTAQANGLAAPDGETAARAKVLAANISSARFRLDMIDGVRAPFADEAERLFALRPELKPLSDYDVALATIDALVPGSGPLPERVQQYRAKFSIPAERLDAVMHASIAECRKRTAAHIDLPENESFAMELVKDKSWGAYNYYLGNNRSLIQINTDLPVSIGSALILGCHEGYPGHHVQGIYNERNYRAKGWTELSVAPLYVPAAPLNEGGADFGVDLAFPGNERLAFEMQVLYPLAGLDPATAPAFDALRRATAELDGALLTISQMHLDKTITREEAISLARTYRLVARDAAEQSLDFETEYRSYVINYSAGETLVRDYVDRAGDDPAARWAAYEHILSTPTLPSDLKP